MSNGHSADGREGDQSDWSEQFCQSSWCRGGRWYVQPDGRARDMWLVSESTDGAPWTVAAPEPICPLCGEALAAHVEGVGDIEAEAPPAVLSFLRNLGRAA